MAFTLSDLRPSDQRLLSVQLHDSVEHAINLMTHHDFNQVPVVGNNGESLGKAVTFDSIVQAVQSFGTRPESLLVRDVARDVRAYPSDADLLTTLDDNYSIQAIGRMATLIVNHPDEGCEASRSKPGLLLGKTAASSSTSE